MTNSDLEHAKGLEDTQCLVGKTVATISAEYACLSIVFTDGSTLKVVQGNERWPDLDACAIACEVNTF